MEDKGVIQPLVAPRSAPIAIVKKDGDLRICIDYQNSTITKTDPYPIPLIHEMLDRLGGTKYFNAIALASGYWLIEMDPEAQQKTAFMVPGKGWYEFNQMPFGMKNAPAKFQWTMEIVLRGLEKNICFVYLDDIIIFGKTKQEHL